jgi:GTP-binding protein YchF
LALQAVFIAYTNIFSVKSIINPGISSMELAIIGLPQVGKKTVYKLLTELDAASAPTKSGVIQGIAPVRDPRIDTLSDMFNPKKTKYAEFNLALPPDISPNASRSADWIDPIRTVDAFIHVVRAFDSPTVFHIDGSVNPERDIETVETELLFADLDLVEKRLARMEKERKKGDAQKEHEKALLERLKTHLENEESLRTVELSEDEEKSIRSLQFLTRKPMVVVFNVGEDMETAAQELQEMRAKLEDRGATIVVLSAAIEEELIDLDAEEREEFMADLGISEPAAHRLSRAAYEALGLISFFTVGPDEVRAWPLHAGSTAPEAAGRIHSDLQRGFIRAETTAYDDLVEAGSEKAAKEANHTRLNGKDYIVQDGDILNIRFNV